MLFGHKKSFQIDLGYLQNEKDRLSSFLQSKLNVSVNSQKNKLVIDSETLSSLELHKAVTDYIHRHNLSRAYNVFLEDKTIKISRFRGSEKKKEKKKNTQSQSMTQTWGL